MVEHIDYVRCDSTTCVQFRTEALLHWLLTIMFYYLLPPSGVSRYSSHWGELRVSKCVQMEISSSDLETANL